MNLTAYGYPQPPTTERMMDSLMAFQIIGIHEAENSALIALLFAVMVNAVYN